MSAAPALDQAAGLRRWARQQQAHAAPPPVAERTLVLFGGAAAPGQVRHTLERWHRQGQRWVGDPARWQVLPVDKHHRDLHPLMHQQPRWGVWIDSDLDAFARTFQTLRLLAELGGPGQVLALHGGFPPQGLLNNLRAAAQQYLGMRLLLIDESGP